MDFRDVELLSAYLDGQLSPSDSVKLESRLASDPQLQASMDDLRTARGLLRQLPQRRVPRNFTLTPKMAGLKAPVPRVVPSLRFATVLAALLFMITIAVNGFAPLAASHLAAAPAPAYGLGGGGGGGSGGGCDNCGPAESAPAPAATSAAPLQPFSALAPTETLPGTQDTFSNLGTPTPEALPKAAAPLSTNRLPAATSNAAPIPLLWQVSIGLLALICGVAAWFLRLRNEQEFRKRWNRK
jgi:hypothetical protein